MENFENFLHFGFVQCTVLPLGGLTLPVLPGWFSGELMFVLCSACAIVQNKTGECMHSVNERLSRGTWCTPELTEVVDKGYVIAGISEVWHYP